MFNGFQLFDYESVVLRLFDLLICLSFTLSFSCYLYAISWRCFQVFSSCVTFCRKLCYLQ